MWVQGNAGESLEPQTAGHKGRKMESNVVLWMMGSKTCGWKLCIARKKCDTKFNTEEEKCATVIDARRQSLYRTPLLLPMVLCYCWTLCDGSPYLRHVISWWQNRIQSVSFVAAKSYCIPKAWICQLCLNRAKKYRSHAKSCPYPYSLTKFMFTWRKTPFNSMGLLPRKWA